MKYIKNIGFLLFMLICFGCSSDLDFNQVKNIKAEPIVVANLASFEVQANEFVTGGVEQTLSIAATNFDVFRDTFFRDNLQRADFYFEFNNTINRAYSIKVVLLDANNLALYSINFAIPAFSGGTNVVTSTEIFQNTKLDLLKSTVKLAFVATLLPGPILSESSIGSLKLRSSATVYLVLQ